MARLQRVAAPLFAALLAACAQDTGTTFPLSPSRPATTLLGTLTPDSVRALAASRGVKRLSSPPFVRPALSQLGQQLFFDRILSGNRDIACATCHLPAFATGDGKSLSVGQGGIGTGPQRMHPKGVFIPRNAPSLFNLSALHGLFWDGRVSVDDQGFHTPAGSQITPAMIQTFEFGAVSTLGMFPVTNRFEMRASADNELARLGDSDFQGIWQALMTRLGAIPEYRQLFEAAYPGQYFDDMTFAHASNAIAGFLVSQMSFGDTPWDRFLAGNDGALSPSQLTGAATFLTLKCSLCHNGATLSDEAFHDVAVAQLGPGESNGEGLHDDFGRMNVTGARTDQYLFRTTPLRNVELTGPFGHDGAIVDLRAFVEHYSESDKKLRQYDPTQLEPSLRSTVMANKAAILAQRDTLLNGVVLTSDLVDQLMAFLSALTDDRARNLSALVPAKVPSRLAVDRAH